MEPTTTPPPAPNTTEARNPDGSLKDVSAAPKPTDSPEPKQPNGTKPVGAPEKYTAFTAPEGHTIDNAVLAKAEPIFRELNLSQEQAQKLVDFHNESMIAASKAPTEAFETMNKEWRDEVAADGTLSSGNDLRPEIKKNINAAIDSIGDAKVSAAFREAMNITGAGNHPAVVKLLNNIGSKLGEGTHVQGAGPSPHGQKPNGTAQRPSLAGSMYPNLPQSS